MTFGIKKLTCALVAFGALSLNAANAQEQDVERADSLARYEALKYEYRKYVMALNWSDNVAARDALYNMIVRSPQTDSLIFSLAYLYYEEQQYTSAALVARELLSRSPKNINYLSLSASSLEAIGALDKALQHYESVYLLTDDTATLYKIAMLQYRLNRTLEGITNADILLERPNVDSLEVSFRSNGDKAFTQYPMKLAAINLKGLLYEKDKKPEKAKEMYQKALAISPDFAPSKENLNSLTLKD